MPVAHLLQVRISDKHKAWIDSQTDELFKTPDLIRGLIDDKMGIRVLPLRRLDTAPTIAAYPVRCGTPEKESGEQTSSPSSSSSNVSPQQHLGAEGDDGDSVVKAKGVGKKPRLTPKYTDDFKKFWATYRSSPKAANGQSKPKAFEQFMLVTTAEEGPSPDQLIEAAANAIKGQARLIAADEWCAPLPDCFRWLRDGCYEAALEDHSTAEVKRYEPKHPASRVFTAADGFTEAW